MTEMRSARTQPNVQPVGPDPTGWVGWILFAGIMLFILGAFQAIAGFVALFQDDYFVVRATGLVVHADYTAWGWIHLTLGVLAVFAGMGVMRGSLWARIYAITLASVSAIANIAFLAAAPVWCTIMIAVDVLVIWALAVHGREAKTEASY